MIKLNNVKKKSCTSMRSFLRNSIFPMYISQNVGKIVEGNTNIVILKICKSNIIFVTFIQSGVILQSCFPISLCESI